MINRTTAQPINLLFLILQISKISGINTGDRSNDFLRAWNLREIYEISHYRSGKRGRNGIVRRNLLPRYVIELGRLIHSADSRKARGLDFRGDVHVTQIFPFQSAIRMKRGNVRGVPSKCLPGLSIPDV